MANEMDLNMEAAEVSEEINPVEPAEVLEVPADGNIEAEAETEEKKPGIIAGKVQLVRDSIQEKCSEARNACKSMMERLSNDMEQTNYNPYIRSTTTYRYEILRKSDDTEPVDVFEIERTSGYSLRALAITGAIVAAADIAVAAVLKKKFF